MTRVIAILIISGLMLTGCATSGLLNDPNHYNTQRGAAIGAGIGALTGQIIGKNTESTLIGTGAGALLGTIIGNYGDQKAQADRTPQQVSRSQY